MPAAFPDYETYRKLYRRNYYGRSVEEHLELGGALRGLRVLDLCGGDGVLTLSALKQRPAVVTLVDEQERMIPSQLRSTPSVKVVVQGVEIFLVDCRFKRVIYDRVFCRQAINYWFGWRSAGYLAEVIAPGGVFVFNTFNQKPPKKPQVVEYEVDGEAFVETSWLVGNDVHHVQMRSGLAAHYSVCKWILPERFRSLLEPFFAVEEIRKGKASLYRCVRK